MYLRRWMMDITGEVGEDFKKMGSRVKVGTKRGKDQKRGEETSSCRCP